MSSTTIHPFPALRAYAEEEARESYSAMREVGIATPYDVHGRKRSEADPWDQLPAGPRDWWISARMSLLCDLRRPASRDAVARLVAAKVSPMWSALRVNLAIEARQYAWTELCNIANVPRLLREVEGPAEALTAIVRHLWPETP